MYEISRKKIPLPPVSHLGKRPRIYPFDKMGVGDSFEAPYTKAKGIRTSANYFSRWNPGTKFTVRMVPEKKCRCWRTK